MKELLNEFREWNVKWNKYDFDREGDMPDNIDVFIEKISKRYEVIKK